RRALQRGILGSFPLALSTSFPNHTTDVAQSCTTCSLFMPFSVPCSRERSLEGHSSAKGAFRTEPGERITERSTKFSNSLTFPGHPQLTNALMVSVGMLSIFLFMRRANFCRKWRTSRGDRKSTRLNSSHQIISYAVFCLKK